MVTLAPHMPGNDPARLALVPLVLLAQSLLLASTGTPQPTDYPDGTVKLPVIAGREYRQGPPDPPTNFDARHYDIHIDVDFTSKVIAGDVTITARSLVPELTELLIDLHDLLLVTSVERGSVPLAFSHANHRLSIQLDHPFGIGEDVTIRIRYRGTPPLADDWYGFRFETDEAGRPVASTMCEPWFAPCWWPCKETPDDKATVGISLTVPEGFIAAANGVLVNVIDNGETKTYNWESDYPTATYLVSAAIADYRTFSDQYVTAEHDTVPLDYYVYPQDLYLAQTYWPGWVPQMLEIQAGFFGEYPFAEEKYGMAEVASVTMEHQTMSSIHSTVIDRERSICHELAHQWWGDMVTCATWHDIWLNEGFAMFCEALYFGQIDPPTGYEDYMEWLEYNVGVGLGAVYRYELEPISQLFRFGVVYAKGAWVLHMLRRVLGDEAFFGGLAAYRSAFAYASATTEDFRAVMEGVSGQSLDWFFGEWVYGVERPRFEFWWLPDTPEPGNVTLHIDQVQTDAPLFKMPIEIDALTGLGTQTFTVWDSLASQEFVLQTSGVVDLRFDPRNWVLEWHTELPGVDVPIGPVSEVIGPTITCMPQPFRDRLQVVLTLPPAWKDAVDLDVYDLCGRRVRSLLRTGSGISDRARSWDGFTDSGTPVASGVYFVRLRSGDREVTHRVVLAR